MNYSNNISPEELKEIERFLQNEMKADESAAFSNRMQADEQWRNNVNEVRLMLLAINEATLQERLNDYHSEIKSPEKKTKLFSINRNWGIAASVLLLIAAATWWITQNNHNERLYSRYYTPDPGLMTMMSVSDNYHFEKAMVEYKNGKYDKALIEWSSLLKENPANDTLLYFMGAALQAKEDKTAAIKYLQRVAADSNSAFQKDACWYLGLVYMNKGEKDKAIDYLQKSEHPQSIGLIHALKQ